MNGHVSIPVTQIVTATTGVPMAGSNTNPSVEFGHKNGFENKGSSVAEGSRIFAIQCKVVTRSFWDGGLEYEDMPY